MVAYNEPIYFDRAIYAQDIRGSITYARTNSNIGILTADEFATIEKGFAQVLEERKSGKFEIKPGVDEIFIRLMRDGGGRFLGRALQEICTRDGVGMIRLPLG